MTTTDTRPRSALAATATMFAARDYIDRIRADVPFTFTDPTIAARFTEFLDSIRFHVKATYNGPCTIVASGQPGTPWAYVVTDALDHAAATELPDCPVILTTWTLTW